MKVIRCAASYFGVGLTGDATEPRRVACRREEIAAECAAGVRDQVRAQYVGGEART